MNVYSFILATLNNENYHFRRILLRLGLEKRFVDNKLFITAMCLCKQYKVMIPVSLYQYYYTKLNKRNYNRIISRKNITKSFQNKSTLNLENMEIKSMSSFE